MAKTKKKVAKNKPLKKVSKKTEKVSTKSSKASVRKVSSKKSSNVKVSYWTLFLNILFLALFIYAGYLLWFKPWTDGVSLIVLLLLIILVSKIIKKIRR